MNTTTGTLLPQRAAIYSRISQDATGREEGVERQEQICQEWAAQRGWKVAHTLREDAISAFDTKKTRPRYLELLRGLRDGTYDAVIVYNIDRLMRQTKELLELLELSKAEAFPIGSTQGEVDLTSEDGKTMLILSVRMAESESIRKGQRQQAANKQRAYKGLPYGRSIPFGYSNLELTTFNEKEKALLENAIQRLMEDAKLGDIAKEWNEMGLLSRRGKQWTKNMIRQLVTNPIYAGVVTYKGEELIDPETLEPLKANWVPLPGFNSEKRDQLLAALEGRMVHERTRKGKRPTHAYILSGLLYCGSCGRHMIGALNIVRRYQCSGANIGKCYRQIRLDHAEKEVLSYVYYRLSYMRPNEVLSVDIAEKQASLSRERRKLITEREEFMKDSEELSPKAFAQIIARYDQAEQKLLRETHKLTSDSVIAQIMLTVLPTFSDGRVSMAIANENQKVLRDRWDTWLSFSQRRTLIDAVGNYTVRSNGKGRLPDVEIRPKNLLTGEVIGDPIN